MGDRCKHWFLCSLLLGCAAPQARPGSAVGPAARTRTTVSAVLDQVLPDGTRRQLPRGASLQSGDRFGLRVTVDRAAYVSVVSGVGDEAEVLYPRGRDGSGRAEAGQELLIPPPGSSFLVKGEPGQDVLYVVAADGPLSPRQDPLKGRLAAAAIIWRAPPPPPPPPPLPVKISQREVTREPAETAQSDASGIAVLRLTLQHE